MKILYLANIRLPTEKAHGLQIMKTCAALSRMADIALVIPTRDNHLAGDPFAYYGSAEQFEILTLGVPDFVRLGRFGFLISALWFSERVRWLRTFWSADLIYSRDAFVLVQYLFLERKLVFEAHAKPSLVSRIVARRAYRVVTISHGLADAYRAVGVKKENIVIAPDAVDEHLFDSIPSRAEARAKIGLSQDKTIVLYAGHLYARKGANTLAAAAKELEDKEIVFVGGTEADIATFKEKWGSMTNIQIVGHVAHEQIPLYLRAADVLVLPNSALDADSARFTSPMKLFEYMASGTPIVASDVPSLREVLSDDACFFVVPDDAGALARGVEEACAGNMATAKAERARALAKSCTWDARAEHILKAVAPATKDNAFYNAESAVYSAKRYPEVSRTFTQFFFKTRLHKTLAHLDHILAPGAPLSLLEIGCADGVVARAIQVRYGAGISRFDAIDAAPEMVRVAKEQHADLPIHFSLREDDTPLSAHDLVVEVGVLNYTDEKVEFGLVAQALRPGGHYVCSVAGSSSLQARLKGAAGYQHLKSYAEYERELEEHFTIQQVESVGFFIPYVWRMPALARVVQPLFEWVGEHVAPALALEKLYILTTKQYG